MITKEELLALADIQAPHCVSIFIPTHRAGPESLRGKDALLLKNQLKQVKQKLTAEGMSEREIEQFVQPITNLLNDTAFWRHQSDGLALFLWNEGFRKYTIPVHFEAFHYVANAFYLKPIIPLFNEAGLFYLLTVRQGEVHLYEATNHSIAELDVADLIPSQLEDKVGYDYEQKGLQFRTQQGNKGEGTFHGQQDLDSTEKEELLRFFRGIDKGVNQVFDKSQKAPLVFCGLDFYFPIYQKINSYPHLFPKPITGNPADKDVLLLHEEALALLQPHFSKERKEKQKALKESYGAGHASADIKEILPAVLDGKVDTLFLQNKADVFGTYDPSTRHLSLDDERDAPNVSLLNLLALKAMKKGGSVYLAEEENMPVNGSVVNALFRY